MTAARALRSHTAPVINNDGVSAYPFCSHTIRLENEIFPHTFASISMVHLMALSILISTNYYC